MDKKDVFFRRKVNLYTRNTFCYALALVAVMALFSSCFSTKRYQYFQNLPDSTISSVPIKNYDFSFKFQPLDEISINVISAVPALAAPFNLMNVSAISGYTGNANSKESSGANVSLSNPIPTTYRVNAEGNIDYPFIGMIHVQNKTVRELKDTLTQVLRARFVKDATVELRLVNPTVTVMGEVNRSGKVSLSGEKTSIIDAILASGDFTQFSNRKDVFLIRERNGEKQIHHVDLRTTNVFESEYYYLRQGDIVFVKPNKDKGFLNDPYTRTIVSYLSMLVGIAGLYYFFKNR